MFYRLALAIFLMTILVSPAWAVSPVHPAEEKLHYRPHGFLDFNTYHDTRNFQVMTLNASIDLPGPFSYFSLTNWQGDPTGADEAFNYSNYLTEQNLFYKIGASPYDLAVQYLSLTGEDNDLLRFGVQAHVDKLPWLSKILNKINARYTLTYFPWQIDHLDDYAFQLQHVLYINVLPSLFNNRLYIGGFADQNFLIGDLDAHNKLVMETQLGYRLYKGLYAVSEIRYNGFFPKGDRFGLGLGLEYKLVF